MARKEGLHALEGFKGNALASSQITGASHANLGASTSMLLAALQRVLGDVADSGRGLGVLSH